MISTKRAPAVLESAQRYTLDRELAECLGYTGVRRYTLDVAACEVAHVTERFFTIHDNGLEQAWSGDVWCNPPYGEANLLLWVKKCWEESQRCRTITMLAPCSTDQTWWQEHVEPYRDRKGPRFFAGPGKLLERSRLETHFLAGRRQFGNPSDPRGSLVKGQPYFWLVALIWRRVS